MRHYLLSEVTQLVEEKLDEISIFIEIGEDQYSFVKFKEAVQMFDLVNGTVAREKGNLLH